MQLPISTVRPAMKQESKPNCASANPTEQSAVRLPAWPVWLALVCLALTACGQAPRANAERAAPAAPPAVNAKPANNSFHDADSDGLPDAAELLSFGDRANFRRWFTAIAELQFYRAAAPWNETQRDCAGLVRFALREALRKHDRLWFQAMGAEYEAIAPDVRAYDLPGGLLGEKLFRTDFGSFQESDLTDGKFSEFADARTLKNYNTFFIGRDQRRAQAGDLLFFHQPWAQQYPYHVMIFLGEARLAGEGANDWVVYHTGAAPQDKGEVKKVRLAVLAQHPDKRWRPVESNQNFLGFYRLRILE